MSIYLSKLANLELLAFAAGTIAVCLILIYLILENRPRQIINARGGEQRALPNTKDFMGRLVGAFSIVALSVLANNWVVYVLALIVIATLVTETDFLVRIVALIWNRKEYWDYETKVISSQQEEIVTDGSRVDGPKVKKLAEKINQDPNGLTDLLSKKGKENDLAYLFYHFERVYRLIFGSQLAVLKTLQHSSLLVGSVERLYKGTGWFPHYPFDQYLGFLEESFLVERQSTKGGETIVILPMGQAFLDYLQENKMNLEKQPY